MAFKRWAVGATLALFMALALSPTALAKKKSSSSSSSSKKKTYSTTPSCNLAGYNAAVNANATSTANCKTCMKTYLCK
jgi:hypothetical protein